MIEITTPQDREQYVQLKLDSCFPKILPRFVSIIRFNRDLIVELLFKYQHFDFDYSYILFSQLPYPQRNWVENSCRITLTLYGVCINYYRDNKLIYAKDNIITVDNMCLKYYLTGILNDSFN